MDYFFVCFYTSYFFLGKYVLYDNYYVLPKSERMGSRKFIHLTISKIRLPVSCVVFESIRLKYRSTCIKSTKANIQFCGGEHICSKIFRQQYKYLKTIVNNQLRGILITSLNITLLKRLWNIIARNVNYF